MENKKTMMRKIKYKHKETLCTGTEHIVITTVYIKQSTDKDLKYFIPLY